MPVDIDSFVVTVEDTLPCLFSETSPGNRGTVLPGSETRIVLDEAALHLDISTPVEGAHDGVPAPVLLDLLTLNFPNDLTRGSFLAAGGGAGHLALCASLSLTATSAEDACKVILDQVAASLALGERIVGQLNTNRDHGGPNHAA